MIFEKMNHHPQQVDKKYHPTCAEIFLDNVKSSILPSILPSLKLTAKTPENRWFER